MTDADTAFEKFFAEWCDDARAACLSDEPESFREWLEEAFNAGIAHRGGKVTFTVPITSPGNARARKAWDFMVTLHGMGETRAEAWKDAVGHLERLSAPVYDEARRVPEEDDEEPCDPEDPANEIDGCPDSDYDENADGGQFNAADGLDPDGTHGELSHE